MLTLSVRNPQNPRCEKYAIHLESGENNGPSDSGLVIRRTLPSSVSIDQICIDPRCELVAMTTALFRSGLSCTLPKNRAALVGTLK